LPILAHFFDPDWITPAYIYSANKVTQTAHLDTVIHWGPAPLVAESHDYDDKLRCVAECRFKFDITPYRLIFECQERQRDTQAWFVIIKVGIATRLNPHPRSSKSLCFGWKQGCFKFLSEERVQANRGISKKK